MSRRTRWMVTLLVVAQLGLILACGSGGVVATRGPRWACPSPTPLPYGEAGPIKEIITHTRPITEGGDWEEIIYYAEWEQEYPDAGGPPFPYASSYAPGRATAATRQANMSLCWQFLPAKLAETANITTLSSFRVGERHGRSP